jgi:hypothetical protein
VLFTLEGHVVNPDIPGSVEAHRAEAAASLPPPPADFTSKSILGDIPCKIPFDTTPT